MAYSSGALNGGARDGADPVAGTESAVANSSVVGLTYLSWMDALTAFGLFAVTAMLLCYAFEARSRWFILAFAGACALGSVYGFLQGAWPFGLVEGIWGFVAIRRWVQRD